MDNNHIRIEILFDYYKALQNQTGLPDHNSNERLSEISTQEYNFNYAVLVKGGYLKGDSHFGSDGTEVVTCNGGIEYSGILLVEKFIDYCVKHTFVLKDKAISYVKKIKELLQIWVENTELFKKALEYFISLFNP